ncbi:MerC domain-containing protein [Bowmanella sp. JS7-9]|uniref:MerC domain-containing protein n=1 Tax=Pseudobowmanella zhangzhouensis TaxID=1537679 RepID=A0ABW1XFC3_9ALTE|nr:MerC domain-containing protein [Bowmanella sp. JS7-9]TBX20806.1 MerC-like membrane protein [Bowmanella sp. JS7-9]
MSISKNGLLDRFGIWISSLCALHCLLLPVLLPILPLIGASIFAEVWFERTILTLSLLVGSWALISGYSRFHRQAYPLGLLLAGGLIYWNKDMFGESMEPFTIAVGALLLITAHVSNLRLCNRCQDCEE